MEIEAKAVMTTRKELAAGDEALLAKTVLRRPPLVSRATIGESLILSVVLCSMCVNKNPMLIAGLRFHSSTNLFALCMYVCTYVCRGKDKAPQLRDRGIAGPRANRVL